MNKRTAKRWACTRGALLIESAVSSGWPLNDPSSLEDEGGCLTEDGERIMKALHELTQELIGRGLMPRDGEPVTDGFSPPQQGESDG